MKSILKILSITFAIVLLLAPKTVLSASASQCEMCKYIYNKGVEVSMTIVTYEQFTYEMDKACSQLAALLQNPCRNMLRDYGEMMYEMTGSNVSPEEGCQQMAMCESDTPCTCTQSSSAANITGGRRTTISYSGCTTCPASKYSCSCNTDYMVQNQGKSNCSCSVLCGAGKFYNNGSCTVCANGAYKSSAGNTSCTTCPTPGKTSGSDAASHDSITDCFITDGNDTSGIYTYSPKCHYSE